MSRGEEKNQLRQSVRRAAKNFDAAWRREASVRIWDRVEGLAEFASADTVALFWSLPDEPDSHDFVRRWAARKKIVLPAVCGAADGTEQQLIFRRFDPSAALTPGAFGISECAGRGFPCEEIDLIVVPGVAFDPDGNRLGRGKGFYDRYLAGQNIYKVGVCFPYQLVPEILTDPHDIKMNVVVY